MQKSKQVYLTQVSVGLGIIAMKWYSPLSKTLELEPHHQLLCSVAPGRNFFFFWWVYISAENTVGEFYAVNYLVYRFF